MPRIPECHPERAHQAKGLCAQCYYQQYDANRTRERKDPAEYAANYRKPPTRIARVPACHPDRRHAALGMCGPCYQRGAAQRATCHPDRRLRADGLCNACYGKRRYNEDPEKYRERARETQRKLRESLRAELLAAYGGQCSCPRCPETNPAFLTLEHVNGDGGEHRRRVGSHTYADLRRRGWPQDGYTLLCWNCNAGSRFTGVCPHMTGVERA